jgi:hypothetical protein
MLFRRLRCAALVLLPIVLLGACLHRQTNPPKSAASTPVAVSETAAIAAPASDFPEPTRSGFKALLASTQAITVRNDFGDVRLRFGGFEHQLEYTAVAQAPKDAPLPQVQYDGAQALISTQLPGGNPVARQRVDLVVFVPAGHAVSVQTLAGLVEMRGLHSDVKVRSDGGAIQARGVQGALDFETGTGAIEVALEPNKTLLRQSLVTRTGVITASFPTDFVGSLNVATSALISTEYSVLVSPQPGQEPNKIGAVKFDDGAQQLLMHSKRGELRLFRRSPFSNVEPQSAP